MGGFKYMYILFYLKMDYLHGGLTQDFHTFSAISPLSLGLRLVVMLVGATKTTTKYMHVL